MRNLFLFVFLLTILFVGCTPIYITERPQQKINEDIQQRQELKKLHVSMLEDGVKQTAKAESYRFEIESITFTVEVNKSLEWQSPINGVVIDEKWQQFVNAELVDYNENCFVYKAKMLRLVNGPEGKDLSILAFVDNNFKGDLNY